VNSVNFLLDTSALLAYIEEEPGADRVEEILSQERVLLPWAVLMEVFYMTVRERGLHEAETRYAMLRQSSAKILWEMNEALLMRAAKLKGQNKLSFADAVIAAYAIQNNAILVHKDPEYEALAGIFEMEILPYK